jgi:hypothetical protein
VIAGSWLIASVKVVCTTHRSFTTLAVCGSNSLTHTPRSLLSYFLNSYFDGQTGSVFCLEVIPVMRWPSRTFSGRSLPNISRIFGL